MFSVTKTGICRRPSCTAIVNPNISGMIVDARDHVTIGVLLLLRRAASTFFANFGCTYGPFFVDLDIPYSNPILMMRLRYLSYRLLTMNLLDDLLRRVRYPNVGLPHGVFGVGIPMGERPSPPPCG